MLPRKKTKTAYYCSQCGAEHAKWQGQCRECNQWNSLIEEVKPARKTATRTATLARPVKIPDISAERMSGYRSGIVELDRVLGGQLLPGMTVLLGGDPGIGKSTLILQAAEAFSKQQLPVLYVTGEESLAQLKLRCGRLQVAGDQITAVNSTSVEEILDLVAQQDYGIVLIDSIQTVSSSLFDSPPGTVAQVREVANRLITSAKQKEFALFLVGHVTKDGMVAGPKVLEHMVDTVIYFEGDQTHLYRMLRATKNRFGSVSEIGLFEMMPEGLVEVANPSLLFLSDNTTEKRSGSVVTAICEGNRPILVEIQALVTAANYGTPQRVAGGIDNKRLALLLAILEKRSGYPMAANDVFVSVAGGLKLTEPAADLPIITAIVSSLLDKPVNLKTLVAGEVGLSGEVRGITMIDKRISEAAKMGFERMIIPRSNLDKVTDRPIELIGASAIQQGLEDILN
ncbi:MAG: DNA repair protein RadA [candidate division Zixibacteria bacterium]|nr:DNA repair protein RadA [candidate division Zixibacteria bacterium]